VRFLDPGVCKNTIRYIGFRQVIRAHTTCLCFIFPSPSAREIYNSDRLYDASLSKWNLRYIPFLLSWCSWMTTFSNLKTYLPSALKHLFGCRVKHLWKKRNIIVTFQSGQLTEQPKTLDDLNRWRPLGLLSEIFSDGGIKILSLTNILPIIK
jgi:hypothetical protein